MGGMSEERSLCPVWAMRIYLDSTSSLPPCPRLLFVSPSNPLHPLSKTSRSFFLRHIILDSGSVTDSSTPRVHSIRGVATSAAFLCNWLVSKVLEATT